MTEFPKRDPATRGESPGHTDIAIEIARMCADKAAAEFERGFFTGSMLRNDFPDWSLVTFWRFRREFRRMRRLAEEADRAKHRR